MKRTLLLLLCMSQLAIAQRISTISTQQLKHTEAGGLHHPVFSPTGEYLLASSVNYSGLKQINLTDLSVKNLTDNPGAGYGVQISADGKTIIYKKNNFVNNLKYTSLVSLDRTTLKHSELVSATREPITMRFTGNKAQFIKGKSLVRKNVADNEIVPIISIEDRKMIVYTGSKRTVMTPNGENASYIWPSISPDKKKIVYTVAGKGTFVCNIDGTSPVALGKLNAPVWLNNRWIVGMDDKDDGEKILSSTLVAVSVDGKVRQTVNTPKGKMAMYPAASADGSKIAFCTENGELYLLKIIVK